MKLSQFRWKAVLTAALAIGLASVMEVHAQMGRTGGGTGGGGGMRSSSGSRGSSTRQYAPAGTIGDAMISYDAETRRIIVIADEDTNLAISQVITNLDKPKPQVLIKVAFLEVTHNDGKDIGVDGSYMHKINNSTTGVVSTAFGLAQQTSGGFYKVLSENYQVTLRALQEAGSTEVLSRPSVLARNNQLATITVGSEVPLITNTRFDTLNNQINTISYTDIGIILRVTPFITSDDMVEMIVSPEISTLTDQTVPIASNVGAPVIAKRSADTVVVTPDHMPVIIGGLMENKKTDSTQKVPILGDIPLLGWAFKRKITSDTKTELIIILTPHIVKTPTQLAALSEREGKQIQLAPKSWSQDDLDRYIDTLPVKSDHAPVIKSTKPVKKKTGKSADDRSKVN
jgi:type II secretory pathway component GspD/PulD (secretin)